MLNYIINLVHNFGGKCCDSTTQAGLIVYLQELWMSIYYDFTLVIYIESYNAYKGK